MMDAYARTDMPASADCFPVRSVRPKPDREEDDLLLGIDIGTTSISCQVLSARDGYSVHSCSLPHRARLPDRVSQCDGACDAEKLIDDSRALIVSLLSAFKRISAIGVTGQMHGIVCVSSEGKALSPLYTWQNGFGTVQRNGETLTALHT